MQLALVNQHRIFKKAQSMIGMIAEKVFGLLRVENNRRWIAQRRESEHRTPVSNFSNFHIFFFSDFIIKDKVSAVCEKKKQHTAQQRLQFLSNFCGLLGCRSPGAGGTGVYGDKEVCLYSVPLLYGLPLASLVTSVTKLYSNCNPKAKKKRRKKAVGTGSI